MRMDLVSWLETHGVKRPYQENRALDILAGDALGWAHDRRGEWIDRRGNRVARYFDCDDYYQPEAAWSPTSDMRDALVILQELVQVHHCAVSVNRAKVHALRPNGQHVVVECDEHNDWGAALCILLLAVTNSEALT
jgi:hypothetical protein